ncbi:homoserine/homoserine lactone efflux protein [Vibrio astriarenae]|nr:homoserine/homoserine lactone efflux protein [Vibrio sp. C7]
MAFIRIRFDGSVYDPGPTVLLVMGQALTHGKKAVVPLISGVSVGNIIAMTFSLAGVGAIISTSAEAF